MYSFYIFLEYWFPCSKTWCSKYSKPFLMGHPWGPMLGKFDSISEMFGLDFRLIFSVVWWDTALWQNLSFGIVTGNSVQSVVLLLYECKRKTGVWMAWRIKPCPKQRMYTDVLFAGGLCMLWERTAESDLFPERGSFTVWMLGKKGACMAWRNKPCPKQWTCTDVLYCRRLLHTLTVFLHHFSDSLVRHICNSQMIPFISIPPLVNIFNIDRKN